MRHRVAGFLPEHGIAIKTQESQIGELGFDQLDRSQWAEIAESGLCRTVFCDDIPIGIGGVSFVEASNGFVYLWASFASNLRRSMIYIFRRIEDLLEDVHAMGHPKIWCGIKSGHKEGIRLVRMLGFCLTERAYQYQGMDLNLYVRHKL